MKKYLIISTILLLASACSKQSKVSPAPEQGRPPAAQTKPSATSTPAQKAVNPPAPAAWLDYMGVGFTLSYPAGMNLYTFTPQGGAIPVIGRAVDTLGMNLTGGSFFVDRTPKILLSDALINEFFNTVPPASLEKTPVDQKGTPGFKVRVLNNPQFLANKVWYYFQTPRGVYEVVLTNQATGMQQRADRQKTLAKIFSSLEFEK